MSISKQRTLKSRGFSLLETLVVLALLAALVVIALPAMYRMLQAYRVQTTANVMVTNLRFARNAALKQKVNYRFTFRDSGESPPNTYLIEYDPQRNGMWQPIRTMDTNIPDRIELDPGSLDQVQFDSRGAANVAGYVLLTGVDKSRFRITLSLTGSANLTKEADAP